MHLREIDQRLQVTKYLREKYGVTIYHITAFRTSNQSQHIISASAYLGHKCKKEKESKPCINQEFKSYKIISSSFFIFWQISALAI